jgi:SurA N-terminal domain
MTRTRLAGVAVIAAGGLLAGLLLARGGHSNPPVAHVGAEAIRRDQLATAVDHFRKEYEAEGKPFPAENTGNFRAIERRLVGLLVYRAELDQAARRFGIMVSNLEVLRKLKKNSGGEEQATDRFAYDTVKSQLQYERLYAKVTKEISAPTTAQLSARRNAAMNTFVERLQAETQVRYEPSYAPGP